MTEIMPVPRNLILLSYQQGGFPVRFFLDKTAGKQYVKANREPSLTLKGENANGLFLLR